MYGLNSSLACRHEDQLLLGNMTNSIYISLSFSRVREERILPCSSVSAVLMFIYFQAARAAEHVDCAQRTVWMWLLCSAEG